VVTIYTGVSWNTSLKIMKTTSGHNRVRVGGKQPETLLKRQTAAAASHPSGHAF